MSLATASLISDGIATNMDKRVELALNLLIMTSPSKYNFIFIIVSQIVLLL